MLMMTTEKLYFAHPPLKIKVCFELMCKNSDFCFVIPEMFLETVYVKFESTSGC